MIPFPEPPERALQKKRGPAIPENPSGKYWVYGYLNPKSPIKSAPPCLILNQDTKLSGFAWRGSMGGVHIGSQEPHAFGLRTRHKEIKIEIDNFFCEDIGENALNIFHKAHVTVKNCYFRGNWKLDPYPRCVGQNNLVTVNGANVTFENCYFFNSHTPIIINTNSTVIIKNCAFSVCDAAISINGRANPRKNDEFDGGKEGQSLVEIENCEFFKTNLLAYCERGGKIVTSITSPIIKKDGGEIEWRK